MTRFTAICLLVFLLLLLAPRGAHAQEQAGMLAKADAYWTAQLGAPGPCAGRYDVRLVDATGQGYAGRAEGVLIYQERPSGVPDEAFPFPDRPTWEVVNCEINFDVSTWERNTAPNRCVMVFHEVGHYYGRDHSEDGRWPIMAPAPPGEGVYYFDPCASMRQRIIVALGGYGGWNRPGWRQVYCDPWEGRVLPCQVTVTGWNSSRVIHYRARTRGDSFAIVRLGKRRHQALTVRPDSQ